MPASVVPENFSKDQASEAVKALLSYNEKQKSQSLFMDHATRFLVDITAFKTPSGSDHFYNICLPFSPHVIDSIDILLIVKDENDTDPDHVVGKVKDELTTSDTENDLKIRQIMTLKQVKDEYSTYEAKRMLAKSVDVIIAERTIFNMLPVVLGRPFYKNKKLPIRINGRKWKSSDLQAQITKALTKTVMNLSVKGQTTTVSVGHDNLSCEQLTENILKICRWISKKYPGGWKNIAKLSLHNGKCPPLVFYFSSASRNVIDKPPVTKVPKMEEPAEGELSTEIGKKVKVFLNGEIEVHSDEATDDDDAELINLLNNKRPMNSASNKSKSKQRKTEIKEESE